MHRRSLLLLGLAAGTALLFGAVKPRNLSQLERRSQELTEALVGGRAQDAYLMFLDAFRDENRFSRFDSALSAWYAGRKINRARSRVIDIRGLGGHASTWIVFEDEDDYSYVYQKWFQSGNGWQLMWLSRILDRSFYYGTSDTAELDAVSEAALRYLTTEEGLARMSRRISPPDIVVAVQPGRKDSGPGQIQGCPVLWLTREETRHVELAPDVTFFYQFATVRILGELALATVDLRPFDPDRPGPIGRRRAIELFLKQQDGTWQIHSIGKTW